MSWPRRICLLLGLITVGVIGPAGLASAHPLGNFTVNRYDGVVIATDTVRVHHVVDLAEIPTLQAGTSIDGDGDGTMNSAELQQYAETSCAQTAEGLRLSLDGRRVTFAVDTSSASTKEGQAGLSTLRIECDFTSRLQVGPAASSVEFSDQADTADVGWREITLAGDGVTVTDSSVPSRSVSQELTAYPQDLLQSPVDVTVATAQVTAGGPTFDADQPNTSAGSAEANPPTGFGSGLLTDVTKSASGPWGMTLALLVAIAVGAAHALAPGHGKSLVAFALAGRRQNGVRSAAAVGATVTATHTMSVLLLGLLIATTSQVVSTSVYPALGLISGIVIVALGIRLFRSALRGSSAHEHTHGHHHDHGHEHSKPQPHVHDHHESSTVATLVRPTQHGHVHHAPVHRRGVLVSLGIAGGLVPSPTAVVVLLATVAAGKAWFGVALVLGFGVGMALTLATIALLVLNAQDRVLRRIDAGSHPRLLLIVARLPLLTAGAICLIGLFLVVRSTPFLA